MNFNYLRLFISLILALVFLNGCADGQFANKNFKHNTPLIKEDIKKKGKAAVDETVKLGPKPIEADVIKLGKRKQISSSKKRNYLLIPDDYKQLKQNVSFRFQNLD